MLKKLYDKSKIGFAVAWIIAYCVLMSVGDALSTVVGVEKLISFLLGALLSGGLFVFLKKNKLLACYGLCKSETPARPMLYYAPLLLLLTTNLWHGVHLNGSLMEMIFYILSMFCVGFLEELIFRGLLFHALLKDSVKAAVIVSSITFGVGHIINLVNGSGAEFLPNLLQVIYATAAGFMFVMIYYKTKSLIVCIITHGLFNALSVFSSEVLTMEERILSCVWLTVITGLYALYIVVTMKKDRTRA